VLPLLATQILWINLVTDSAPALAMGVDPAVDDPMARAPRKPTDKVIGLGMWVQPDLAWPGDGRGRADHDRLFHVGGQLAGESSLEIARTAGFTVLVLIQLFNAFNSRSMEHTRLLPGFLEPVAGGRSCSGSCCRSSWSKCVPAGRLWDRAADLGAVGHLCGDGLDRPVGRGDPKVRGLAGPALRRSDMAALKMDRARRPGSGRCCVRARPDRALRIPARTRPGRAVLEVGARE